MIRHAPSIGLGIGLSLRGSGARFSGILDQYAGAAAAYSLRALSSAWLAGDVVEVRRSSDSSTQGFTASQIDSGAMVDFVKKPGAFTNDGFETFANNGTGDGFTATNTASTGFAKSESVFGVLNDVVTIEFDLTIVSGSPSISLRSENTQQSNLVTYTTSGSKTAVLTATGGFNNFTFSEGDVPSEFTVSNVRVSTNDGFVSTWYDQSGNGNDATQATTTSQPKIVDAGALVTGGLDFDGVDDWLQYNGLAFSNGLISIFIARTLDAPTTTAGSIFDAADDNAFSASNGFRFDSRSSAARFGTNSALTTFANTSTSEQLQSGIKTSTDRVLYLDGAQVASDAVAGNVDFTSVTQHKIGAITATGGQSIGAAFLNGQINEIIVYNTDQSANRTGIETNINDHYSIY